MKTDVLIVGSGSAGVCSAAWLAKCHIPCIIIDKRDGPLVMGQADGVQVRTVEIYESFGVAQEVLREGNHIREVTFWVAHSDEALHRTGGILDSVQGISHLPHVTLNQARMHELLLDRARYWNNQEVTYSTEFVSLKVDDQSDSYPIKATVLNTKLNETYEISAKYLLGCDGAHSAVRRSLGYKMIGDSTDVVWGVMDVYPRTNFPDIRMKSAIRTPAGSLLTIPREGGSLVRFYIQLESGTNPKTVKLDDLIRNAKSIFAPFEMEIADTFWWSVYTIGQRVVYHFSYKDRVFLAGDACHTHSPKAGQGMNISLQDGYDIGWKIAHVLQGLAHPNLLKTYADDRAQVARDLIEFDRSFTKMYSEKDKIDAEVFNTAFRKSRLYTTGVAKTYARSSITYTQSTDKDIASGAIVGMRISSPTVVKLCDAKTVRLTTMVPADGRWRIIIFPGDIQKNENLSCMLNKWGDFLDSLDAPPRKYLKIGSDDVDSVIETLLVLAGEREKYELFDLHRYFTPITGKWKMNDVHKVFVDCEGHETAHGRAYEKFGIDINKGAVIIVRPDHFVSAVFGIEDQKKVSEFFSTILLQSLDTQNYKKNRFLPN